MLNLIYDGKMYLEYNNSEDLYELYVRKLPEKMKEIIGEAHSIRFIIDGHTTFIYGKVTSITQIKNGIYKVLIHTIGQSSVWEENVG